MRHRKRRTRFGRQSSHRKATLRSLARAVITHSRIKTTHTKAKEARRLVEHLITIAKDDSLSSRRQAYAVLGDRPLVKRLFGDIAPLFRSRKGGYTRIVPFNFRKGDGASVVFLELTEIKPEEKVKPEKKAKKKEEKEEKPARQKKPKPEPAEKEQHRPAPEVDREVKEEKTVEEVKKEKARDESKKIEKQKGFLKKVKGFFRRKTNM